MKKAEYCKVLPGEKEKRGENMEQIIEEYGISILMILVGAGVIAALGQVLQLIAGV